jgi:hypothetical protein
VNTDHDLELLQREYFFHNNFNSDLIGNNYVHSSAGNHCSNYNTVFLYEKLIGFHDGIVRLLRIDWFKNVVAEFFGTAN